MTMLVDIRDSSLPLEEISSRLKKVGSELKVAIQIHHENILKAMHRV